MSNVIQMPNMPKRHNKKLGRPRIGADVKSEVCYFRVTKEDKEMLDALAQKNHVGLSTYLRIIAGFVVAEEWMFVPSQDGEKTITIK